MSFLAGFLVFTVGTLVSAFCLWAGMKITKVQGTFSAMLIISAVSLGASFLIPFIGGIAGTIVMFFLIIKMTDAEFWPDAVLMVLVARVVEILLHTFVLAGFLR